MRPSDIEILRGLQGALMSVVTPELHSLFAQDTVQTAQMLLEMLANELDTAADSLARDNRTIAGLLAQAREAIRALPQGGGGLASLAEEIDGVLAEPDDGSLAVSALNARHRRLSSALERVLAACEDAVGQPQQEPLMAVRAAIYGHLREVAIRGWSFWDVFSFRGRMTQIRAQA